MILIIDTFNCSSEKIIKKFKLEKHRKIVCEQTELLHLMKNKNMFKYHIFIVHSETIDNYEFVKYFFEEVYEVKNDKIYYYNKKKYQGKVFCSETLIELGQDTTKNKNTNDVAFDEQKLKSLPFLDAQSAIKVKFPAGAEYEFDEEEEEEYEEL
ncbi:hypothetical protein EDEG_02552 [Edhazardia aedis USNM 41457]|uniref:Uncharacterized protein n=1 Tax=Edhazardia aedis (strain USNM 41457) TaxID=1003232 RepID=J8ZTV6_EDHAE|nr:hypothetical protein EDEG_02552 [Edhazardia aedis USNM 41457]|eukprot:EJW03073.1 hypothetical protein EDEG_02552 [Edhazardia aedis USNM 41457]